MKIASSDAGHDLVDVCFESTHPPGVFVHDKDDGADRANHRVALLIDGVAETFDGVHNGSCILRSGRGFLDRGNRVAALGVERGFYLRDLAVCGGGDGAHFHFDLFDGGGGAGGEGFFQTFLDALECFFRLLSGCVFVFVAEVDERDLHILRHVGLGI